MISEWELEKSQGALDTAHNVCVGVCVYVHVCMCKCIHVCMYMRDRETFKSWKSNFFQSSF